MNRALGLSDGLLSFDLEDAMFGHMRWQLRTLSYPGCNLQAQKDVILYSLCGSEQMALAELFVSLTLGVITKRMVESLVFYLYWISSVSATKELGRIMRHKGPGTIDNMVYRCHH